MSEAPWAGGAREVYRACFDDDVDAYDATRPVAPAVVFDDLLRLTGLRPGAPVMEIGPGTGQATRSLAARGLQVLAVELGPALAARARANLRDLPHVSVVASSFEAWEPGPQRFDAVVACNSFHWLDASAQFGKTADVLRAGGHLAVMSTPVVIPEGASRFWWDVQDDWEAVGVRRRDPADKRPNAIGHIGGDLGPKLLASGRYASPAEVRHAFDVELSAEAFATNLSTQSGVRMLAEPARAELLTRVRRRVDALGGTVVVHHVAILTVAQRVT